MALLVPPLLLLTCLVLLTSAGPNGGPLPLARNQEEWPEKVGCPTGYTMDVREKTKKQRREGYVLCVEGNSASCVDGSTWNVLNRRFCFKCTCHDGLGDCVNSDCPPPKPVFLTETHYNCKRRDPKVCPSEECKFLMRDHRCVYCDCPNRHAGEALHLGGN